MGRTVRMSRMSVLSKIPEKKCPKFKKMSKNKKKMSKNKINCTIFRWPRNRCCNSIRGTSLVNSSGRHENKMSVPKKKSIINKIYYSKFQRERETERERDRDREREVGGRHYAYCLPFGLLPRRWCPLHTQGVSGIWRQVFWQKLRNRSATARFPYRYSPGPMQI